jgi:uncharacterized protein
MKEIHAILKISERCNLRCTYCYFFFGGDNSYEKHSPIIRKETIEGVIGFLLQGARSINPQKISLILHGGEPLLIKKQLFNYLCTRFY